MCEGVGQKLGHTNLLTCLYLSAINSGGLQRFHVDPYSFCPVYDNEIYMIGSVIRIRSSKLILKTRLISNLFIQCLHFSLTRIEYVVYNTTE